MNSASTANNPAPDSRPHFVDNRNGLTLDKALREHRRVLREQAQFVFSLDIATAFFVGTFCLIACRNEDPHHSNILQGSRSRRHRRPRWRRVDRSDLVWGLPVSSLHAKMEQDVAEEALKFRIGQQGPAGAN